MAIAQLRPKEMTRLLDAVPALIGMPSKRIVVDYDTEADVLYVSFERPQKATDSELRDDGVMIRRRGKRIVGITVLEASKR
ncbi:MAG: hypothetical protein FLDDKLPJ_03763 [Phycisphaerae bacterium]|nr:hypothetical protein [Phycisphaerae bacterium]